MKSQILRRLLVPSLLALLCCGPTFAKDRVVGMSEKVFKFIGEAQEFIDIEDYAAAREVTDRALKLRRLSDYERAHLLNVRGYTFYEEGDLEQAISNYNDALQFEELPESMLITLYLTLGQINLVAEDYPEAEKHLRALLAIEKQDTGANKALLAASLMGQERHEEALQPLLDAIEAESASGGVIRENWLSMLSSVYYELGDYAGMRDTVEQLVILYPREQYIVNLAALHGELGETERQLALIESLRDDLSSLFAQQHLIGEPGDDSANFRLIQLLNVLQFEKNSPVQWLEALVHDVVLPWLDRAVESGNYELALKRIEETFGAVSFDQVAGCELAGVPYAAMIADRLGKPLTVALKQGRGFGRLAQFEGTFEAGVRTLLVDDLTTDGRTKSAVRGALAAAQAEVVGVFVLLDYDIFPKTEAITSVVTLADILTVASDGAALEPSEIEAIRDFHRDAPNWSRRHGGIGVPR